MRATVDAGELLAALALLAPLTKGEAPPWCPTLNQVWVEPLEATLALRVDDFQQDLEVKVRARVEYAGAPVLFVLEELLRLARANAGAWLLIDGRDLTGPKADMRALVGRPEDFPYLDCDGWSRYGRLHALDLAEPARRLGSLVGSVSWAPTEGGIALTLEGTGYRANDWLPAQLEDDAGPFIFDSTSFKHLARVAGFAGSALELTTSISEYPMLRFADDRLKLAVQSTTTIGALPRQPEPLSTLATVAVRPLEQAVRITSNRRSVLNLELRDDEVLVAGRASLPAIVGYKAHLSLPAAALLDLCQAAGSDGSLQLGRTSLGAGVGVAGAPYFHVEFLEEED